MALLNGKEKKTTNNTQGKASNTSTSTTTTATAKTTSSGGDLVIDLGAGVALPQFMPSGMVSLDLCKSQDELEKIKQALAEFRKVVAWTKQKFKAQETAADLALELAKSKNALIAHYAKTVLKQAKSDAEVASLLQALPQMITGIQGTVAEKKEKKVKDFTDRLAAAGKPKQAA